MPTPEAREVEACEERLRAAMLAEEVTALDSLLDDALIFTNHDGTRLSKADDLAAHRSGMLTIDTLEPFEQTVRVLGDAAAAVCVRVASSGRYGDQRFAGSFAYTRLWCRAGADWRVAVAHCSAISGA